VVGEAHHATAAHPPDNTTTNACCLGKPKRVCTQTVASTGKNATAVMVDGKRTWEEKDQPRSLPAAPWPLVSMVWRKKRRERLDLGFLKISNDLDEEESGKDWARCGFHVLLCLDV
jgi:hypothetical protein